MKPLLALTAVLLLFPSNLSAAPIPECLNFGKVNLIREQMAYADSLQGLQWVRIEVIDENFLRDAITCGHSVMARSLYYPVEYLEPEITVSRIVRGKLKYTYRALFRRPHM